MILLKLLLTVPVAVLLTQPLWAPQWGGGILAEVAAFGPVGGGIAVLVFLGLVALYCRDLQRTLEAIPAARRTATPRSVWLMFVIPYNFVEDFFIVGGIAASLARDGRTPGRTQRIWRDLGLAWCGLQILSLLPGPVGVIGGVLALLAWAVHWGLTRRLIGRLSVAVGDSRPQET